MFPSLYVLSYTGTCATPSSHHLRIKVRSVCVSALKTEEHQPWAERRNDHKDAYTVSVLTQDLSSSFPRLCRFHFSTLDATSPSPSMTSVSIFMEWVSDLQIFLPVSRLTASNSPPSRSCSGVSKKEVYLRSVSCRGLWWEGLSGLIGPPTSGCNMASTQRYTQHMPVKWLMGRCGHCWQALPAGAPLEVLLSSTILWSAENPH